MVSFGKRGGLSPSQKKALNSLVRKRGLKRGQSGSAASRKKKVPESEVGKAQTCGEEETVEFVIEKRSQVKERARHSVVRIRNRMTGEMSHRVRTNTPKATRDHEKFVSLMTSRAMKACTGVGQGEPFDGPVRIAVLFRFSRSDFPHNSLHVTSRAIGDLDNHVKSLLDGMNGIAFIDDSQITEIMSRKELVDDGPSAIMVKIHGRRIIGAESGAPD